MTATGSPRALADLQDFSADPFTTMDRLYRENGAISELGAGPMRCRVALGAEASAFILANSDLFSWEAAFTALAPLTGPSALLVTDGERHRRLRRLVTPALTARRVERHLGTVTRHIEDAMAGWAPGDIVDLYPPLRRATRAATLESLFGAAAVDRSEGLDDWLHDIHRAIDTDVVGGGIDRGSGSRVWRRALLARSSVHRWVVAEIRRRGERNTPGDDVLGVLLRGIEGDRLTADEITDQLVSLLEAGAETTAAQLSWLLYCTLSDRERWARAAAGLDPAALDHHVSEAMRLYPATAVISRKVATGFTLAGTDFAPGDLLIFSPFHTHRLASLWPDPERFDPGRWDPGCDRYRRPAPHEFLPFGVGPHRCIGANFATMAIKVAFTTIAGRIDAQPLTTDARPAGLIGMHPADGITVRITAKR
ncbi:cytochrome P450 [Nocardia cyriacigeorgica]|uniref:Putative cytochrome P450 n=1 Tax=Nocardia cyriacigeorgica (strain GUH-2) TaxID=1127134 RepID=H6R5M7_NOCCG|nr:cytochrome P450 [Nocardia cyriacigeorgica]CCF63358.1 putative cytochrome P450 [Nocardia cyriacigeorgica GUH-2]